MRLLHATEKGVLLSAALLHDSISPRLAARRFSVYIIISLLYRSRFWLYGRGILTRQANHVERDYTLV